MARLPIPGQDDGNWGTLLNQYLLTVHTNDGSLTSGSVGEGTIQPGAVGTLKLKDNSVTEPKLAMTNSPATGQFLSWDGTAMTWAPSSGTGVTDHGALTGLSDDDHPQYHTDGRGDARYYTKTQADTLLATKEPTVTIGSTSQYYRGDKTWQTLDKTAVGLNSVDNTADTAKPVSTAQQTALNGKASISHTHALDDLSDVSTAGAIDGQVLKYTSGSWAPGTDSTGGAGDPTMGGDLSGTASNAQLVANAVGATELASNAVTNSKVDAAAAIAQSKIANLTTDLAAKEPTIAPGTVADYYRGDKTWQALNKTTVGLSNVNNTSDLSKPISTATQTALDAKAVASNTFAFIVYGGSSYANRSTVTADATRVVVWIGPTAPGIGGNGAVDGVDIWWNTST